MPGQITYPTPGSVLQGPVPEVWDPQHKLIDSITNAVTPTVTTTVDHGYTTGLVVRLVIPPQYGMTLFKQTTIVVTGANTFTCDADTSNLDPFVPPTLYPPVGFTPAQVTPMTGVEDNISR